MWVEKIKRAEAEAKSFKANQRQRAANISSGFLRFKGIDKTDDLSI